MKVLNFGSLNIDFVYTLDHFVRKGETISSEALDIFSGGKGLNQSIAMGRAGISVYHAGAIGADGQFLIDLMEASGVDTRFVRTLGQVRTGNAVIQKDKSGDNCIILYGGANREITREQIDETLSYFDKGDFIILQNEINEMGYLIEQAYQRGMVIVLNPSPMDETILQIPLGRIRYFVLNEIEAGQLLDGAGQLPDEMEPLADKVGQPSGGMEQLVDEEGQQLESADAALWEGESLAKRLAEKFPEAQIVLTLGGAGSIYAGSGILHRQPIYPVKAVDTTAAGDTFTGYLIAGILKGLPIEKAMDLAAKAAAITVSGAGAAPSIPTMERVEKEWFDAQ